jgi:hypothetical protein
LPLELATSSRFKKLHPVLAEKKDEDCCLHRIANMRSEKMV